MNVNLQNLDCEISAFSESKITKCAFIAVLGRPNAGKSTLLNNLLGQKISLVSHKANATRKRLNIIVMHENERANSQMIFIDTPGIHKSEKLLNQYMLDESIKAMGDCDLALYLAPASDSVKFYEEFLRLANGKNAQRHILILTKIDQLDSVNLAKKIKEYEKFKNKYLALIPHNARSSNVSNMLNIISEFMPNAPFLFDTQIATDTTTREIVKELIRESIFENFSDEIPYESDVVMQKFTESKVPKIQAKIIVEKQSQKGVIIGKNGSSIKRIGIDARQKIEHFLGCKVFLGLSVELSKGWSKKKENLKSVGYDFLM